MGRSEQHCNDDRWPTDDSLTQLRDRYTHKAEKCHDPLFCPQKTKMGINAFSIAKSLTKHNISATMRYNVLVSKDHLYLYETMYCGSKVMWPMTSRDSKTSRSWPRNLWSSISRKSCETDGWFKLITYRKPHFATPMVTWPMTSRDPKKISVMTPMSLRLNILKSVRDRHLVQIDYRYGNSSGHVPDDVTWPQKVKVMTLKSMYLGNHGR